MSTPSDSEKETVKHSEKRKGVLDAGERVERRVVEKQQVDGAKQDEGRSREKRGGEAIRKEEKDDERRPKREREEPAKRERYSERRFREVKERDSSRHVRERDVRERDTSREIRERDSSREVKDRDSSREVRDRDSSRSRRPYDRWRSDDRSTHRGADQDQDRSYGRGRGRRFVGASRQVWPGRYNGNDGSRHSEGNSRQDWGDGDRDVYSRRQHNPYQSRGDRWQHDMFETLSNATNAIEPEEDPVAKVEALLAS